jgi:hypothetical protein
MSNEIILPSLEKIQQMEAKRQQAIEALQINEADNTVNCQKCGAAVAIPIAHHGGRGGLRKSKRIAILEYRIKWMEDHYGRHATLEENTKPLKQELAELLKQDAEYDKLRSLPLYSSKISGWKFVCSNCFQKLYSRRNRNKKKLKASLENIIDR